MADSRLYSLLKTWLRIFIKFGQLLQFKLGVIVTLFLLVLLFLALCVAVQPLLSVLYWLTRRTLCSYLSLPLGVSTGASWLLLPLREVGWSHRRGFEDLCQKFELIYHASIVSWITKADKMKKDFFSVQRERPSRSSSVVSNTLTLTLFWIWLWICTRHFLQEMHLFKRCM